MHKVNEQQDIGLFSHLIQTVLHCRLTLKNTVKHQIQAVIARLQSNHAEDKFNLKLGTQLTAKLHQGPSLGISKMLQKHFVGSSAEKYCIFLQIFELHDEKRQPSNVEMKQKTKLIEKWVFQKDFYQKTVKQDSSKHNNLSDLILRVLSQLRQKVQCSEQNEYTTIPKKGYQLIIKTQCPQKKKNILHVLHHEKINDNISIYRKNIKASVLQLPKFWQKSMVFNQHINISVGCYRSGNNIKLKQVEDIHYLQQPDRKFSAQTKSEQKDSTSSSFRFSLENLSFRLTEKNQSLSNKGKSSEQPWIHSRPRYQSIYESRDEEMNIFILSPRKLSQQESPKIKHLEQRPIQFQIHDSHYLTGGISQEVIEEFILQPEQENASNASSDGFQMLQENDQLDSIKEQRQNKMLEQTQRKKKEFEQNVNKMDLKVLNLLLSIDKILAL